MREFSYKCSSECKVAISNKSILKSDFAVELQGVNKVMLFVSEGVAPLFINELKGVLTDCGVAVYTQILTDGESIKSIQNACDLATFLQEKGFCRNDLIINLGGGTVCDLGGFIASVYKRGINYINIPTTLLCAVDACIGGKTAVDINGIKNLLGSFKQPQKVIVYIKLLSLLSNELLCDGLSEIIKYGVINAEFLNYLLKLNDLNAIKQNLSEIIFRSLKIKAQIVAQDEYDFDKRQELNLGHTTAHALESVSNFKLNHAKSVALGLKIECELAKKLNLISQKRCDLLQELFKLLPSVNDIDYSLNQVVSAMQSDKKNRDSKITFILPSEEGVTKVSLTLNEVLNNLVIKNA